MAEKIAIEVMEMTAGIVSSYVTNNQIKAEELPALIKTVHGVIMDLSLDPMSTGALPVPAVPIDQSITPDFIICLEDGRKLKMLKRYLRSRYELSPEDYRIKWGLPSDYPMVAPNYAKRRSDFAKEIGLGKKK